VSLNYRSHIVSERTSTQPIWEQHALRIGGKKVGTEMKDLKQALREGEVLIGPFSVSGNPQVVETIGYAGFDFVLIDCEHAPTSPYGHELESNIRAALSADIAPVVRITWNDPGQILKAADMGAQFIVVPHVNTAEEAAAAVRAAQYYPRGRRSAAPPTLASKRGFIDWATYYDRSIKENLILPLIEEPLAVENVEEIAAVEGLAGIYFGPFDLAVALGKADQAFEPDVAEERTRVYAAAKKNGLPIADLAWTMESALKEIRQGAQLICIGTDVTMLANACRTLRRDIDEGKRTLAGERTLATRS
jgi:4-hydroxy-2-oxoheptanedioate aldolase